jgi:hypothetical protein
LLWWYAQWVLVLLGRVGLVPARMVEQEMLLELRTRREPELAFRALENIVHIRLLGQ